VNRADTAPEFLGDLRRRVDERLPLLLGRPPASEPLSDASLQTLYRCCDYALAGGGKRIRPILVYLAAAAVADRSDMDTLDHPACAVEMVHCYSLVHDDLPAMDDDDLRRGRPSCHKAFGDALAILAGDALQSRAFELLASTPGIEDSRRLAMVRELSGAIGPAGMVGGQAVDIAATDNPLSGDALRRMHGLKTGALISAAVTLGAITAGADDATMTRLSLFSRDIGLAFQVVDDILDVVSDRETLGKTPGKDSADNKPTYVSLLGLDGARAESARLLQSALAALEPLGPPAADLRRLAMFIVERAN